MEHFLKINSPKSFKSSDTSPFRQTRKSSTFLKSAVSPESSTPSRNISLKKPVKSKFINKEIQKIEEDFNVDLLKLNQLSLKDRDSQKQVSEELKLTEKVIENSLIYVQLVDKTLGSFLIKAWKKYQRLERPEQVLKKLQVLEKSTNTCQNVKESYSQTKTESEVLDDTNLELYIEHLNRAIDRIDVMNHERLVNKLKLLLDKLYENGGLDLEDSSSYDEDINAIFLRNKQIAFKPSINITTENIVRKKKIPPLKTEKYAQTTEKLPDEISLHYLRSLLIDKENKIFTINREIKRLKDIEERWKLALKEISICKDTIRAIISSTCSNCKSKVKEIEINKQKILDLNNTLKSFDAEEDEIEALKKSLNESQTLVAKSGQKIVELSENIDGLNLKISEVKAKKRLLKQCLRQEEMLRAEIEEKLKEISLAREMSFRIPGRKESFNFTQGGQNSPAGSRERKMSNKKLYDFGYNTDTQKNNELRNQLSLLSEENEGTARFDSFKESLLFENSEPIVKVRKLNRTDIMKKPDVDQPIEKPILRRSIKLENASEKQPKNLQEFEIVNSPNGSSEYKQDLIKILKISKEEYKSLPKNIRQKLFECLFEHREKCGSDCEHLRRAAEIQSKIKGKLYPIKKYNI